MIIYYIIKLYYIVEDIIKYNKFIILLMMFYKTINLLTKIINIRDYTYDGDDLYLNNIKIGWFNSNSIYYRFKITQNSNNKIIILNRNDILLFDKIKLIIWFLKECISNILCNFNKNLSNKKILPEFLIKKYILQIIT